MQKSKFINIYSCSSSSSLGFCTYGKCLLIMLKIACTCSSVSLSSLSSTICKETLLKNSRKTIYVHLTSCISSADVGGVFTIINFSVSVSLKGFNSIMQFVKLSSVCWLHGVPSRYLKVWNDLPIFKKKINIYKIVMNKSQILPHKLQWQADPYDLIVYL